MALTPEEEAELAELSKSTRVDPAWAQAAAQGNGAPSKRGALFGPPPPPAKSGAVVDQPPTPGSEEELGGIQAVYGKDWEPYGPGGEPIAQTPADRGRDEAVTRAEAERVAGMLDPRFSIVPQILALQPATNDPDGDEAAQAKYEAGQKDAIFIYEPPVAVVRKHLLENPSLLRAVSPNEVPSAHDIETLTSNSALYKAAADYMYKQSSDAATAGDRKIIRWSEAPWVWDDKGVLESLSLNVKGFRSEAANMAQAFVLGADDMGAAGIGRATQEFIEPTSMLTQPRLGLNESVPQSSKEVNAWTEEEYPIPYGLGQGVGMLNKRSVFNHLWQGIEKGGSWLAKAAMKTRLGGLAAVSPPVLKGVAGALGDAATGTVAAGAGQVLQEGVDAASRGELPDLREAGERVTDVGKWGGYLGGAGSATRRLSHGGAEIIRDSPRYSDQHGPGLVRRTEPNLDWSPPIRRAITGPRISGEMREVEKEASVAGRRPSDVLAERIAGPVGKAAQENTQVARGQTLAERRNFQHNTEEGKAALPMTHLQEASLEGLRDHHQPLPGGGLHPVDDKYRAKQKVFNGLVEDVSTSPVEGAAKLTADEAGAFLGARSRYKLMKDDIEAAAGRAKGAPVETIDREAYLKTLKDSRARQAADEEIEASIEDIVGDVTPTAARRASVEQQVLRELVDEARFVEAHGSVADYLKQRGIDAVYVKPRAYDARRADKLTEGLPDEGLTAAAKIDRRRRTLGGEKGGYDKLITEGEAKVAKAEAVEKSVAPDGDAFQPIAGLYHRPVGEKQLVDQVQALAEQAGGDVPRQLGQLRGLQSAHSLRNRARAAGPDGRARGGGLWNPNNLPDVLPLRAFPILKSLEGPLGPLRGSSAGRVALMGGGETAAAERRAESGPRAKYERERAARMKAIDESKAEEKAKRDRRRARREGGGK